MWMSVFRIVYMSVRSVVWLSVDVVAEMFEDEMA